MPDELKPCPCPFCGHVFTRVIIQSYFTPLTRSFIVYCPKCQTEGPVADSQESAMKLWDTRHAEAQLTASLAASRQELERARAALKKMGGLACNVTTLKHVPAWIIEQAQTVNDLCEKYFEVKD